MNERDFLSLAHSLTGGGTEVAWRTAVSRAYYAAFHVARNLLQDLGFTVPHADRAHAFLWLRLGNCGDIAVQTAASDLNLLRRHRNQADYDLKSLFTQGFAQARVHAAERIIQALDKVKSGPARTQITDAMKIYERDVLHDVTWRP